MPIPRFKIEVGSTELSTDLVSVEVVRIENAVSLCKVLLNDYKSKNYIANIDLFGNLKVNARYKEYPGHAASSWTEVFDGTVEDVEPKVNVETGELVLGTAYGQGRALRNTHCNTSYGTESQNPTIDTPGEIWTDIIDNYVEKSFGGSATGYSMSLSKNNDTTPTIKHLYNPYINNMDIINTTLLFIQANRAGSSSHHWIVGTDGTLRIKRIGTDISGWSSWWNTDRDGSTLVEGEDFISYGFSKRARSKDFANKIILTTDLRKPGYDHWSEYRGAGSDSGSHLWHTQDNGGTLTDDNTYSVVGSYSLKLDSTIGYIYIFYPSSKDAAWDFTKIGSEHSIPTLNFYIRNNRDSGVTGPWLELATDASNDFYINKIGDYVTSNNEFIHLKFPVGPYYNLSDEIRKFEWQEDGSPDWSNINWLRFNNPHTGNGDIIWLDDIHFAGKIVREAKNSTNISNNDEHQKIIRMNTAVDDSMKAADATGTAGMLAYAELLIAQKTPIVATLETPGIVDILPGQYIHVQAAEKSDGSFRIDSDFRVKQVNLTFKENGFRTVMQVTDDLTNSFAKGPAEALAAYYKVVFTDPEAQSLRATGIDILVPCLSKDYPS